MTIQKPSLYFVWISPRALTPPHAITNIPQVRELIRVFKESGWDTTQPALVGYEWGREIQLLSGTHRRAAALGAKIKVPVWVWNQEAVEAAWGKSSWDDIMKIGERYPEGFPDEAHLIEVDTQVDLMVDLNQLP